MRRRRARARPRRSRWPRPGARPGWSATSWSTNGRHRRPEHRGVDGAGADGVHPHAGPAVLLGRHLGQADDAVLRRGVGRHRRRASEPGDGRAVHDRAAARRRRSPGSRGACRRRCRSGRRRAPGSSSPWCCRPSRLPCSPSMPAALNAASRRPKVPTAPATASFTRVVVGDVAAEEGALAELAELGFDRLARRPRSRRRARCASRGARRPRPRPGRCRMRRR